METLFLACFIFGALFTAASVLFGFAGGAHFGLGGHGIAHVGGMGHASAGAGGAHAVGGQGAQLPRGATALQHPGSDSGVPYLNASSVLAFLTWFGATGYVLEHWADWLLLPAILGALLAGAVGWVLILLFLRTLLKGESEMDPADYRIVGTVGRVGVTVPAAGLGEVVYSKAGSVRSEAARSLSGRPIPRDTEVVVTDYARGVALVQPWSEFMAEQEQAAAAAPADSKPVA